jgi:hypothetical protein
MPDDSSAAAYAEKIKNAQMSSICEFVYVEASVSPSDENILTRFRITEDLVERQTMQVSRLKIIPGSIPLDLQTHKNLQGECFFISLFIKSTLLLLNFRH